MQSQTEWIKGWRLFNLTRMSVMAVLLQHPVFAESTHVIPLSSLESMLLPPVEDEYEEVGKKNEVEIDRASNDSDKPYFWQTSSVTGELTTRLNTYWQWHRLQNESGDGLLQVVQLQKPRPQQDLMLATFVHAQSDELFISYSKSQHTQLYLYSYPIAVNSPAVVTFSAVSAITFPAITFPGEPSARQLLVDVSRQERVQYGMTIKLPLGPQRLVLRFAHSGADSSGESVTVHDLVLSTVWDTDTDGLPDSFEHILYGNLVSHNARSAALADKDQDGLSDFDELQLGTHPVAADSDDDGMPDGWEHRYGLPITRVNTWQDSDDDQVSDYEEWLQGSDPRMDDAPVSWLLTFGNSHPYGFYFWPAYNPRGDIKMSSSRGYWQRVRNAQDQWVLKASSQFGREINLFTATFFKPLGRKARVTYSKSAGTQFFIYSQTASRAFYDSLFQDLGNAARYQHSVTLTLQEEPQRLVFRMSRPDSARQYHLELHSVLLPAVPDSNQNGVSDAFEHIYCYTANCFSSVGLHVR